VREIKRRCCSRPRSPGSRCSGRNGPCARPCFS